MSKKERKKEKEIVNCHKQSKRSMFACANQFPLCVFVFPFVGAGREWDTTALLFHRFPFPFVLSCKQRSFSYRASPELTRLGSFLLPFPHCPTAPSPTSLPVSCLFPLVCILPPITPGSLFPQGSEDGQRELSPFFLIIFFFFFQRGNMEHLKPHWLQTRRQQRKEATIICLKKMLP